MPTFLSQIISVVSAELLICLAMILPLVAMVGALAIKKADIRETFTLLVACTLCAVVICLVSLLAHEEYVISHTFIAFSPSLSITFHIEWLGMLFALVASFLWIVTSLYAIGYLRGNNEKNHGRFFAFFSLSISAVMGIAMSANLLTLFVFYEILTLATVPLVGHHANADARGGVKTYLTILLGTSVGLLLPGIMWVYYRTGTLDFTQGGVIASHFSPMETGALLVLFAYGVGKAALMPIHRWLPAAMVAPTPVSALLHAVAVVKAGVFTIVKLVIYIFGTEHLTQSIEANWLAGGWLLYIAGFSIMLASMVAMRQDNLKKRLAYSTISQLSYVTMAAAILAPKAVMAAGFHILAHAVGKITLFFAAGSIYTASGKKYVSELNGIGKRMPITMAAFTIAAFSMIGLPPTVGFISKYYMLSGAFEYGQFFAIIVITISTVLNAMYFLPIIYAAYFKEEDVTSKKDADHKEAPLPMVIAISVTAFLTLLFFALPDLLMWLPQNAVYQ